MPPQKRKLDTCDEDEKIPESSTVLQSITSFLWSDSENSTTSKQPKKRTKLDENQNQFVDGNGVPRLSIVTECNDFLDDNGILNDNFSIDIDESDVESGKSLIGTLFSPVIQFLKGSSTDQSNGNLQQLSNDFGELENSPVATEQYCYTAIQPPESPPTCYQQDNEVDPYQFIRNIPPVNPNKKIVLPLRTRRTPKMSLVLDLDETLVHCSLTTLEKFNLSFEVIHEKTLYTVYARTRPYLFQFLEHVSQYYEVILFTASQKVYANKLIDLLDPKRKYFHHRLFRQHCIQVHGAYVKDLSILGRDLQHTMIVDNSPQAFAYHLNNGIPIESWYSNENDEELLQLLPFLDKLYDMGEDVRPHIRDRYRLHEQLMP